VSVLTVESLFLFDEETHEYFHHIRTLGEEAVEIYPHLENQSLSARKRQKYRAQHEDILRHYEDLLEIAPNVFRKYLSLVVTPPE
jgi:hypothetical protein